MDLSQFLVHHIISRISKFSTLNRGTSQLRHKNLRYLEPLQQNILKHLKHLIIKMTIFQHKENKKVFLRYLVPKCKVASNRNEFPKYSQGMVLEI